MPSKYKGQLRGKGKVRRTCSPPALASSLVILNVGAEVQPFIYFLLGGTSNVKI